MLAQMEDGKNFQEMMLALWQKHLPEMQSRIELLKRAGAEVQRAKLTDPLRAEARMAAHKLAGVLGTFGRQEGSAAASAMELLLEGNEKIDAGRFDEELRRLSSSILGKT